MSVAEFNVALFAIGGLIVSLSLVAGLVHEKVYVLSEPMAAVGLGVVIGPLGLGVFELSTFGDPFPIVEQFARLTVGLAVMGAALRLPPGYIREHVPAMAAILLPGMVAMWLVSSALASLFLAVSLPVAALIGAIVTPTDPVLAGTIVTGGTAERFIPEPIRDVLTAESGANDGLAYPLVFAPILFVEHAPGRALREWLVGTVLWEVGSAVVIGAAVGAAAGWIERESRKRAFLERASVLTVTVALTFAVLGGAKLVGSEGILAAFVAGLLFNRFVDAGDRADEQQVQETVLRLFTFPVFVLFGTVLPVEAWVALGPAGVGLVAGVLCCRRLPMVVVFRRFVPSIEGRGADLFAAWFGPVGIAALYYATVAHRTVGDGTVWPAATLVIAGSVLVHGLTATPLTRIYGRSLGRDRGNERSDGGRPDLGGE
ncbi:cation:proton antiporter [Saliphagus sp. LR7]|uniref:cation:proton antiporter domain-containing protein n=1 Tax=Saliphagus sp. LR7 TaxID=2282654 RepID=UPI000DF832EB|nr:cation:proton antiporter [Saliphagus sp. LR7]